MQTRYLLRASHQWEISRFGWTEAGSYHFIHWTLAEVRSRVIWRTSRGSTSTTDTGERPRSGHTHLALRGWAWLGSGPRLDDAAGTADQRNRPFGYSSGRQVTAVCRSVWDGAMRGINLVAVCPDMWQIHHASSHLVFECNGRSNNSEAPGRVWCPCVGAAM
jgi:hypothetical protein